MAVGRVSEMAERVYHLGCVCDYFNNPLASLSIPTKQICTESYQGRQALCVVHVYSRRELCINC